MHPLKVLAVDDANTVLMMEQLILRGAGFEVVLARDGEEAVEKARSERPDIVIMDVVMPKLDGFEACKRIRAENATVPILLVTTRGTAVNRATGFEAGCTAYMTKPFNRSELLDKVGELLRGDGEK